MHNLEEYLTMIENEIEKSKFIRFSNNKVAIDKEYILDIIIEMRANLPNEINRAKKISEEHDNIINDAKKKATNIIEEAKKKATKLVEEHEIYKGAIDKSNEMLEESKKTTHNLSLQYTEYVDGLLDEASKSLTTVVEEIEKNQKSLIDYYGKLYQTLYENREKLRGD